MNPTYPYFRFPDQATFEALDASSFHDVIAMGELYIDGELVDGFHVNTSTFNDVPAEWQPYRIYPNNPQVKFAGDGQA